MYTSPFAHFEIAYQKQRELIGQAERYHVARQLREHVKTNRSVAARPQRRSWRTRLSLRTRAYA